MSPNARRLPTPTPSSHISAPCTRSTTTPASRANGNVDKVGVQGTSSAPTSGAPSTAPKLRRRTHRQHLQPVRADRGARAKRLQRAKFAVPPRRCARRCWSPASGQGDGCASRRHTAVARNATVAATARPADVRGVLSTAGWRCIRRRWPPKTIVNGVASGQARVGSAWRPKPMICSRAIACRISGCCRRRRQLPGPSRPIGVLWKGTPR